MNSESSIQSCLHIDFRLFGQCLVFSAQCGFHEIHSNYNQNNNNKIRKIIAISNGPNSFSIQIHFHFRWAVFIGFIIIIIILSIFKWYSKNIWSIHKVWLHIIPRFWFGKREKCLFLWIRWHTDWCPVSIRNVKYRNEIPFWISNIEICVRCVMKHVCHLKGWLSWLVGWLVRR